jgi:hypothetical protein
MRRSSVLFHLLGAVGVVGLLSACSGGGGGSSGTTPAAAPATPIVSSGTITKFGSVYINDREYLIDASTSTSVDGSAPVFDDGPAKSILKVGMVVKVSGTTNGSSRTASTITHTDTLEGPQTKVQVDKHNGTLRILGQTVVVDDTTHFDDGRGGSMLNQLDDLVDGDVVEVSGFVKDSITGVIVASFIEKTNVKKDCLAGCEIEGIVTGHIAGTTTFKIGGLIVDYEGAAAADIKDMPVPIGSNWNGLFVEVKGTVFNSLTTTLNATKVEREDFQAPEGNEVELEGIVMSVPVPGSGNFMLGTTEVQAANAQYLGGLKSEVAVGQNLEVEGTISGNVITAGKVKFQDAVRLEGNVKTLGASTMTLDGLTGIIVSVNGQTEFKKVLDLTGLKINYNVRIRGRQGAGNTVIATEVELIDTKADTKVSLQGVVQSLLVPSTITILGIPIDTSGLELRGTDDLLPPISSSAFFGAVKPTITIVKAQGDLTKPSVWKEVELESD